MMLLLIACGQQQVFDTPIPDDGTFERGTPTDAELANFEAAAAYSAEHNGQAVMVLRGQTVLFEDYQNEVPSDEPNHLFSGTKSFSCAIAMAMVEDGLLDLDEPVSDTITEWDDARAAIVVRDLLHFTTGLKDAWWKLTRDGLLEEQRVSDKYATAISMPQQDPLGTFLYKATDLFVFGALVQRKTGEDPVAYLQRRVLDPITMQFAGWMRDPEGNPMMPYGAWTTANEWAKFGVLVRDQGAWQGQQVLPTDAFETCLQGSTAMPAYGLNFWLNAPITADQADEVPANGISEGRVFPSAPEDAFMAAGYNENRLYIVPSADLVIVRLGDGSRGYVDDAFLASFF